MGINIAGIEMKNPVMPASGTFGYGEKFADFLDLNRLGAIVTKGITFEPREGNNQPRIFETTSGMINRIGLQNPGVEAVIAKKLGFLRQFDTPVIVNIAGKSPQEFADLAQRLDGVEGVAGLEINISCPNVEGVLFGASIGLTYMVVRRVRRITKLPLIVKLTPNVTDVTKIAEVAEVAGADAISLINTLKARAKIQKGPNAGEWIVGGLSGPAIKPVALEMVNQVASIVDVPIIGMGGISSVEDALDFFEAGATAIAVGTANFRNPRVMINIIEALEKRRSVEF